MDAASRSGYPKPNRAFLGAERPLTEQCASVNQSSLGFSLSFKRSSPPEVTLGQRCSIVRSEGII